MSMNTYQPNELAEQRKITSDLKNKTDNLTFTDSRTKNNQSKAKAVRDKLDSLSIKALERETVTDYYNLLLEW